MPGTGYDSGSAKMSVAREDSRSREEPTVKTMAPELSIDLRFKNDVQTVAIEEETWIYASFGRGLWQATMCHSSISVA